MSCIMREPTAPFAYRPDIDGLRAIAVLAVLVFHLGFSNLEGGFLGVDVFFVISGFLITSIIAPKIKAGEFSFKVFYLKRIRRLVPPALVTIIGTFIASCFILDPNDLINMAKSALAAVFSVSNFLFFSEAGYWDTQSELKPLLHSWSLGVEEQFYLIWPLLILLLCKIGPRLKLVWAFGLATLIGIAMSEWILRLNPSAAFFLLPARFFEFSIGAFFSLLARTEIWNRLGSITLRSLLGIASLIVLIATFYIYKGETAFPGLNALIPCLATAFLLLCGSGALRVPIVGLVLANPVMVWVGRLSYSLYLVHWPIVSLMRYKVGLGLELRHQLMAIFLTAILTLVLYYGVERRISSRRGQHGEAQRLTPETGRFALRTGFVSLCVCVVFLHAALTSGWTWRFPDLRISPEAFAKSQVDRKQLVARSCQIRDFPNAGDCKDNASFNILIFGNSHEPDGLNFLSAALGDRSNVQFVMFGQFNACRPDKLKGGILNAKNKDCLDRLDILKSEGFMKNFQALIYSSNRPFSDTREHSVEVLKTIRRQNPDLKIVTFGGYVNTHTPCYLLINETGSSDACVDPANNFYNPDMDQNEPFFEPVMALTDYLISYRDLLCGEQIPSSCLSRTPDKTPYAYDKHHKSFEFARFAGQKYMREYPEFPDWLLASP